MLRSRSGRGAAAKGPNVGDGTGWGIPFAGRTCYGLHDVDRRLAVTRSPPARRHTPRMLVLLRGGVPQRRRSSTGTHIVGATHRSGLIGEGSVNPDAVFVR